METLISVISGLLTLIFGLIALQQQKKANKVQQQIVKAQQQILSIVSSKEPSKNKQETKDFTPTSPLKLFVFGTLSICFCLFGFFYAIANQEQTLALTSSVFFIVTIAIIFLVRWWNKKIEDYNRRQEEISEKYLRRK